MPPCSSNRRRSARPAGRRPRSAGHEGMDRPVVPERLAPGGGDVAGVVADEDLDRVRPAPSVGAAHRARSTRTRTRRPACVTASNRFATRSTASRTTARATSSSSGPMRAPRPHAAAHVGCGRAPSQWSVGRFVSTIAGTTFRRRCPPRRRPLHGPRNGRPRASDPSRRCRSIARTSSPPRSVRPPNGDGPCPRRRGSRARASRPRPRSP